MKILNIHSYLGEDFEDLCASILFDAENLESYGVFDTEPLVYINRIV